MMIEENMHPHIAVSFSCLAGSGICGGGGCGGACGVAGGAQEADHVAVPEVFHSQTT